MLRGKQDWICRKANQDEVNEWVNIQDNLLPVNIFIGERLLVLRDALFGGEEQLEIFEKAWCKVIKRLASPSFISTQPLFVSLWNKDPSQSESRQEGRDLIT